MTKEQIKNLLTAAKNKMQELAETAEYNGQVCGLRIDDDAYGVGEELPVSRIWDDGDPTDDSLDGTSCLKLFADVDYLAMLAKRYLYTASQKMYLVIGYGAMAYPDDEGEIVIANAEVVEVLIG